MLVTAELKLLWHILMLFANKPSGLIREVVQLQISSFLADVCYLLLLNSLMPSSSCLVQLSFCHLSQFFL